jgi:hypothetical protein
MMCGPTLAKVADVPAAWIEIDRDECLALLQTAECGRLATTSRALPAILPVGIEMRDQDLTVRSLLGSQVPLRPGQVVALEVGNLDALAGDCWTVVVTGILAVGSSLSNMGQSTASRGYRLESEFVSGWQSGKASP